MNNQPLKQLTELSRQYGADPEFVIGGGGNTSYKDATTLFIKPSGVALGTITEADFLPVDRSRLSIIWQKEYSPNAHQRSADVLSDVLLARRDATDTRRPSVEVLLHHLLPQRFVAHTHPPMINGLTCGKTGAAQAVKLFDKRVLYVPYVDPGYILAMTVEDLIVKHKKKHGVVPSVLLLENHGLLAGGESIDELHKTTAYVLSVLKKKIKQTPDFSPVNVDEDRAVALAPAIRMLLWGDTSSSIVTFCTNKEVMNLVKNSESFLPISSFSPDHIVFCKHEPLFVGAAPTIEKQYQLFEKALTSYRKRNKFSPLIVVVEGLGFFAQGASRKTAENARLAFLDAIKVVVYSKAFGGPRFMTDTQIDFINNWEMETFRKKVAAGAQRSVRIDGNISIVTGAAQGFGKGIALNMADEGAMVVVADLNKPAADSTVQEIVAKRGSGSAIAVVTNVADEKSVQKMVNECVLTYGGIDTLVNNAGILRAGAINELDVATFELVTKVNYTAFFICVKHVAAIMKIQNRFKSDRHFDIIQINSKSGLQGSKANSAYAGGKFGGIGLVQSFALELVGYNVKVNAVCPGNFFEGPLWSDPKNGLFVQYLNAKKVPGAKTVADVKRFYESKVPMGRGCLVGDVVKAILYVIEQKYETGQAVPVTGGQVMLK